MVRTPERSICHKDSTHEPLADTQSPANRSLSRDNGKHKTTKMTALLLDSGLLLFSGQRVPIAPRNHQLTSVLTQRNWTEKFLMVHFGFSLLFSVFLSYLAQTLSTSHRRRNHFLGFACLTATFPVS